MADDLAAWATGRAPELRRRAEEEAVAVLRDALLRAAIRERGGAAPAVAARAAPARTSSAPAPERRSGEILWTYCVLGAGEPVPDGLAGVDPGGPVERVSAGGLVALVSRVPAEEFAAEPLRANLNDIGWLERVARAHEGVLEKVLAGATIVPLRLCTLYETEDGVRRMLKDERDALTAALEHLDGRQEWGVKVLVDPDALAREAGKRCAEEPDGEDDRASGTGGGAYMLRRRRERRVREVADALATDVVEDIHASLCANALDSVMRPPQNRELSEHQGEMLLNAAYLVDAGRTDAFREVVSELGQRHRGLDVRLALTGPWPPYNFVPGAGAGPLT